MIPAEFVKANRSALVSALIKATRMRKMTHALYYCALLLLGGQRKWYVSRRVGIMACEDGVDDVLMRYVSLMHTVPDDARSSEAILRAIVAINLRPNWWANDFGRQMMLGCLREHDVDLSEYTTSHALERLLHSSLFTESTVDAWVNGSAAKTRLESDFGWTLAATHGWLIRHATRHAVHDWQCELIEAFRRMTPDITRFGDENWNYIFRYLMSLGRNPDTWSIEQLELEVARREALLAEVLAVAARDLANDAVAIPPWAYDGIHVRGSRYGWSDRRFTGTLEAFDNCLRMFERYGRLDPRDQGIRDGYQVPTEGLVLGNEYLERL